MSTILSCIPIFWTSSVIGYCFFIFFTLWIILNLLRY